MKVHYSSSLNFSYFKALSIIKKEQPDLWKFFCEKVPTFSAVSNYYAAAVLTHIHYRHEVSDSVKVYKAYWKKDGRIVLERLNEIFGDKLSRKKIVAYVCITPLYIRNIEKGIFLLPVHAEKKRIMNIIVHELSHFYCYEGYEMYGYDRDDAWQLSEYLVPYLIQEYFGDLCQIQEVSYVGETPDSYERHIKSWIERKISFSEMLTAITADNS